MNTKLVTFRNNIKGKNVAVIGIGISNRPLIGFLAKNGARVTAYDKKSREELGETYAELEKLGVSFRLGEGYLDEIPEEIIFKTPGMRFDMPQLTAARARGAVVTSEMEVFFELCPAKIIAVTGSDGKTTTTTLIHKFLSKAGYKTWLGGNIGKPLLAECENIAPDDIAVLELSSFQLHTMKKSPHIAVITNITPNHLDVHKSYEEYINAKKNIMRYQTADDILVLNEGNEKRGKRRGAHLFSVPRRGFCACRGENHLPRRGFFGHRRHKNSRYAQCRELYDGDCGDLRYGRQVGVYRGCARVRRR